MCHGAGDRFPLIRRLFGGGSAARVGSISRLPDYFTT